RQPEVGYFEEGIHRRGRGGRRGKTGGGGTVVPFGLRALCVFCGEILQQDVGGLEVAVDDALAVGVLGGVGQGFDQDGGVARRQRGSVEFAVEPPSRAIFHREERAALAVAHLEDLHDVRVL